MGFLFGPKKVQINNSENKVSAISIQNSAQGVTIPIVYGKTRITGNNIWYGDFTAVPHTETSSSGSGKGGGGGTTTTTTTYTYTVGIAIALCEGPINGVGQIWENKNISTETGLGLTSFLGSYAQSPWTYLTTAHPTEAFGYRGIAYEAHATYQLGTSTSLPNLSFEVKGLLYPNRCQLDVSPKDILADLLPSTEYGACFPSAQMGDWTSFDTYCKAAGVIISPAYTTQRAAADIVTELCLIGNSAPFWSEGLLKITPYADQSVTGALSVPVYTFTPVLGAMPEVNTWYRMCFGNGVFCAITQGGGSQVKTSTSADGLTWSATGNVSTWTQGTDIAWNGSVFCAFGQNKAATSPDGVTWTNQPGIPARNWQCGGWDGSVFVAVEYNGTHVATSPTGVVWTEYNTLPSVANWRSLVCGGGKIVVTTDSSTKSAVSSDHGATWTAGTLPSSGVWYGLAWNGSIFCAIRQGSNAAATSSDGATWSPQTTSGSTSWGFMAWDSTVGVFCTVSAAGSAQISPDGVTWTAETIAAGAFAGQSIAYGNGVLACAGYSSSKSYQITVADTACIDGASITFTPNTTVNYALTDDDFLAPAGEDPIKVTRKRPADAFNSVVVQCRDRSNNYNNATPDADDQAAIDLYGSRQMPMVTLDAICVPSIGRKVAQTILSRNLYYLNTYEFTLPWKYARLEPMDLVSLTDAGLGLSAATVRVLSVEEDEDGNLAITAEDFKPGTSNPGTYSVQSSSGYIVNNDVAPGNANTPVIFQPPLSLSTTPQIWVGASGGTNWGGAEVWVSTDGGTSYGFIGTIVTPARQGALTAPLPVGSDPDLVNTASVDLTTSRGSLVTVTQPEADADATLSHVNGTTVIPGCGELVSFETATLTSAYHYDLTYLRRGQQWSSIVAHIATDSFLRLDGAIGKFDVTEDWVGVTLKVKLLSFNTFGGGLQALADVTPISYTVQPVGLAVANNLLPTEITSKEYLYIPSATVYSTPGQLKVSGRLICAGQLRVN